VCASLHPRVVGPCIKSQQSTSMRGTEGYCKHSYSECYRNDPDLNDDSSDCEIMKATQGEKRLK